MSTISYTMQRDGYESFYKTEPSMQYLTPSQIETLEKDVALFASCKKANELKENLKGPHPFKGDFWTDSKDHSYKTWSFIALHAFRDGEITEDEFATICSLQSAAEEYHSPLCNAFQEVPLFTAIGPEEESYTHYFSQIFKTFHTLDRIQKEAKTLPLNQRIIFLIDLPKISFAKSPMNELILNALPRPFFFLHEKTDTTTCCPFPGRRKIHFSIGLFKLFLKTFGKTHRHPKGTFTPVLGAVSGRSIALGKKKFERVLGLSIPSVPAPHEADGWPVGPSSFEDHDRYHCIKDAFHSWGHRFALNRIYDLLLKEPLSTQEKPSFQIIFGLFVDAERLCSAPSIPNPTLFSALFNWNHSYEDPMKDYVKELIFRDIVSFPDFWKKVLTKTDLKHLPKVDKALMQKLETEICPTNPMPLQELANVFVLSSDFLANISEYLDLDEDSRTSSLIDFIQSIGAVHEFAEERLNHLIDTGWMEIFKENSSLSPKGLGFILSIDPTQISFIFDLMNEYNLSPEQIAEKFSFNGFLEIQNTVEKYKENPLLFKELMDTGRLDFDCLADIVPHKIFNILLEFPDQIIEPLGDHFLSFESDTRTIVTYLTPSNTYCVIGNLSLDKKALVSELFTTLNVTLRTSSLSSNKLKIIFNLVASATPEQMALFTKHLTYIKTNIAANLKWIATASEEEIQRICPAKDLAF